MVVHGDERALCLLGVIMEDIRAKYLELENAARLSLLKGEITEEDFIHRMGNIRQVLNYLELSKGLE